jgi:thiosulfate/3-mercaptopyruvate sulfurtransferase
MGAVIDPAEKLQGYAHPERLVTTDWLAEHLDDPTVVVAESDEDVLLYSTGHIPGAVKIDWHTDLNDPVARDYVDAEGFARLMSEKGISRDTTIVFYGDNFNWWAAYALWVASLFGHPDARLLDGGRQKWLAEGRPTTRDVPGPAPADYPLVTRDDSRIRAFRARVLAHARAGGRLVDVRSPGEFSGELLHMPDYPQEGALRGRAARRNWTPQEPCCEARSGRKGGSGALLVRRRATRLRGLSLVSGYDLSRTDQRADG